MRAFEASADIAADAETVWAVLTDGDAYTSWDSGVIGLEGRIAEGEKLKVTSSANPGRAFPVEVVELDRPRRMVWQGGMPLGLFKGVRTFSLEPAATGTRFHTREEYSGPLAPLIGRSIPDLQPSFDQFAAGLKARAERGAA